MTDAPEPKPCRRFAKRFVWNARLVAHLPCEEYEAMIACPSARFRMASRTSSVTARRSHGVILKPAPQKRRYTQLRIWLGFGYRRKLNSFRHLDNSIFWYRLNPIVGIATTWYAASEPSKGRFVWPRQMAKTILVADDNPTIREMLCNLFEPEEGYEICAQASNGQEAIELALECRPDLVILDLSMPVMDGLAAARELKRLMPNVPIILFTQYADLGKHMLDSTLSVDRVVSKTDCKEIIGHVRSLIPV